MNLFFKTVISSVLFLFLFGCSNIVQTQKPLPRVYKDINATHTEQRDIVISLFPLKNYTDTPRAGMRAANIIEGVLLTKGYIVINHLQESDLSMKEMKKIAKKDDAKYFLYGGVSEWRYKTGIDGEPAVSLKCVLYKTKNMKVVWSATASDSDWGNASIGTTAQNLIESMLE